jgi:hypothetical protein
MYDNILYHIYSPANTMPRTVTFDTNTLADVISLETSQHPSDPADAARVRAAIQSGKIQGVFCETLITLEGIKNAGRSAVFGSTSTKAGHRHEFVSGRNGVTYIDLCVEQTARRALDQRQADRFLAAFGLGMKLLGAPRIAMVRVDNPDGERYVVETNEAELTRRLQRQYDVTSALEARGLGCAQAQRIALEIQTEVCGDGSFLLYLGLPRNPAEQKKINRAIAEWSDGDSIAAHYGYGIDLFCSQDFGKNASGASILDDNNRKWLSGAYGIRLVTLAELADMVTI